MRKRKDSKKPQEQTGGRQLPQGHLLFVVANFIIYSCITSVCPGSVCAAQSIPGESGATWFFHLTHLPLMVYAILFLILVLSVVNLWFHAWHSLGHVGPHSLWDSLKDMWQGTLYSGFANRFRNSSPRLRNKGQIPYASFRVGSEAVVVSEVVGAPRLSSSPRTSRNQDSMPTPLDGIDHPLPQFRDSVSGGLDHQEKPDTTRERDEKPVSFKFSSAVDIPSREEIDRRDKTQLVVSGFVMGPNGKGLPSVLVFLTDLEGNRVGQSCRTAPETGEYKVLVNEPGKYVLRAYKRGMMMESGEELSLPLESGKIEGLNFVMIPDGCVVKGRIRLADSLGSVSPMVVRCQSRLGDYTGESISDADGNFSIVGVPPNCECYLEIVDASGKRLHVTDHFETVQKNRIEIEIQLPNHVSDSSRVSQTPQTIPST